MWPSGPPIGEGTGVGSKKIQPLGCHIHTWTRLPAGASSSRPAKGEPEHMHLGPEGESNEEVHLLSNNRQASIGNGLTGRYWRVGRKHQPPQRHGEMAGCGGTAS